MTHFYSPVYFPRFDYHIQVKNKDIERPSILSDTKSDYGAGDHVPALPVPVLNDILEQNVIILIFGEYSSTVV